MSRASRSTPAGLWLRHLAHGRSTSFMLALLVSIAVIVIALIPRAVAALAQDELHYDLTETSPLRIDLTATGRLGFQDTRGEPQTGEQVFETMDEGLAALKDSLNQPLSGMLGEAEWVAELSDDDAFPDNPDSRLPLVVSLALGLGLEDRVRFIEGAAPEPWTGTTTVPGAPGTPPRVISPEERTQLPPIEIALSADAARQMKLGVGDRLGYYTAPLLVSGVYEPIDPEDDYWKHAPELSEARLITNAVGQILGVRSWAYINPLSAVGLEFELDSAQIRIWYPAIVDEVRYSEAAELLQLTRKITALGAYMPNGEFLLFEASISEVIGQVIDRIVAITALLALTGSAPLGVVLAVLALGVRTALERRRSALALIAARGATTTQLRVAMLLEGVLVAVPACLAALLLANYLAPGPLAPDALILPAVVALAVPVLFAATTSPRLLRTARSDLSPRARRRSRWVIEVVLVGLAALALYLLIRRGLVTSSASLGLDPLLAATPLLLALATCVLVLRLYPAPLLALQRRLKSGRSAVGMLGAARAVRETSNGFAGVLAIVVAVSAAVFSLVVGTTVSTGLAASARESVGADIRIEATEIESGLVDRVREIEGVQAAVAYDVVPGVPMNVGQGVRQVTAIFTDIEALRVVRPDLTLAATEGGPGIPFFVSPELAESMEDETTILSGRKAVRVGIVPPEALPGATKTWILVDEQYAADILEGPYRAHILIATIDPESESAALGAAIADTVRLRQGEEVQQYVRSFDASGELAIAAARPTTAGLSTTLLVAAAVSLLLGVLAIVLTTLGAAAARNRLVGVLRMLGMTTRQVRGLVAWELAPVAIAAVVAGTALGIGLSFVVASVLDLRPFVGGLTPVSAAIPVPLVGIVSTGFAVVIILTGFIAIATARRINPATTIKMGAE